MNQRKRFIVIFLVLMTMFSVSGCKKEENRLEDGFYTVEMSDYINGWKEFVTIRVSGSKIVTVEYNSRNSSGFTNPGTFPICAICSIKKGHIPTAIHEHMQLVSWHHKATRESML